MKSKRYSKFLAGLVTSLILFSLLISPALAAAGDTTRVSVASDGTQGNDQSEYLVFIHLCRRALRGVLLQCQQLGERGYEWLE